MAKIDDSVKKKVPELRFKGFTDEWEERKLKDVVEKQIKGKAQFEKLAQGDVEYLDTSRLNGGQALLTNGLKDVSLDDILILWDGSKAGTVYHGFEGALGSTLKAYRTSANSKFVYQYLKRHQDNIYNNYRTPNIPHVQKDFLNVFTISIPGSDEQAKIGSFFKKLDDTIALHQRKLDLLKEQKKGYLQKMFPKNGAKVPELRFAGFADDWEERKLGDLATSFEYGLNASAKSFDGTHKYIRITDIDDSSRKFNSQSLTSPDIDLSSADNYKLKNGDILFARTGASVGKSYIYADSDGLVYYAGFLIRARIKSGVDSNFVFQHTLTSSYENFIRVTSQRSGQPGVNAKEYSTFEISVPSYEEQRKIGSFFQQLDDTIALHQRKLDLLKEQKKGYLQKMFV